MNILIIGCGKVGACLAQKLCIQGHDISIVDSDPASFDLLPGDFTGLTVPGVPIDQDVLRQAGIEDCDALAALTEDDNTNIMVCQIARELFSVERIIARIYDPSREDIFSRFHLNSICPTNLTVASAFSLLTNPKGGQQMTLWGRTFSFSVYPCPEELLGLSCPQLAGQLSPGQSLFGILTAGGATVLNGDGAYLTSPGDQLILAEQVD